MVYTEMRAFLEALEAEGELVRISKPVSDGDEIGAFIWEMYERHGWTAPAVLFENVVGRAMPLVINVFGSIRRWGLMCGLPNWRRMTTIKEIRAHFLENIRQRASWPKPVIVAEAPCKEVILKGDDVNLGMLPAFRWHPDDGGPYITLPGVVMKDPEWRQNLGIYRIMIHDARTAGLVASATQDAGVFCARARQRGQTELDCAVALGYDPILHLAGAAKMPEVGRDAEFRFTGGLTGKPVELVRCETIDVEVPASSEIVLEGKLLLNEKRREGPFGEYTGYTSEQLEQPYLRIHCITQRRDPIYVSCTSGHVYSETNVMTYPQPFAWYAAMQKEIVGFRDLYLPLEGRMYVAVVQIKKRYPGWGKQAIMTALGSGFGMTLVNTVIVVDEDINIYEWKDVLWALSTRVDPELDVVILPAVGVNALNPAARARVEGGPEVNYTSFNLCSKLGIDATRKTAGEAGRARPTPPPSRPAAAALEQVRAAWEAYGMPEPAA
ncbi:MAG: UbiD family decarboxylase [Candidatus Tectomicrobia bacterium]|nr:UbiD family decarboxylase [Candidatus Tectomicrobia bacterium]